MTNKLIQKALLFDLTLNRVFINYFDEKYFYPISINDKLGICNKNRYYLNYTQIIFNEYGNKVEVIDNIFSDLKTNCIDDETFNKFIKPILKLALNVDEVTYQVNYYRK